MACNKQLREDLREWFTAWLAGYHALSTGHQREFLLAMHAHVRLWRTGQRTPRSQLVIALPTNALDLPPAPGMVITVDERG